MGNVDRKRHEHVGFVARVAEHHPLVARAEGLALALVDAVPGDLTDDEVRKVGQLLSNVLAPGDSFWLAERLAKPVAPLPRAACCAELTL
ncbi:MAG: hypothetical protein RL628_467 [Actinomycetota bacterium]